MIEIVTLIFLISIAKAELQRVMDRATPLEIMEAKSNLAAAGAEPALSQLQRTAVAANVSAAQAQLDYLESLPLPEDIAVAQADVARAQISVDSAEAHLERSVLLAPINGTVIDVFIHAYEYARIGLPVVRLSDLNDLSVEVLMDELDVAGLLLGDEATVTFEALPGISAQAVITSFSPNLDINDPRDFKVELKLLDVPDGLRWGMTAVVAFNQ